MREFIFVTGSLHKVQEAEEILGIKLQHQSLDLLEIQALDCAEVVESKARAAYLILKRPVIVEDTGLRIHTWGKLPGALIRWFIDEVHAEGICKMLASFDDRSATAETVLGFFDGQNFKSFRGEVNGKIAVAPKGSSGFGWDRIFIPEGSSKTFAELLLSEKLKYSMRAKAFLEFQKSGPTWT